MALSDLIRLNKHRPVRKAYMKRRLLDGTYEASWYRFDNYNGRDRIIDWGSIRQSIDDQPGIVASFEVSDLTMVVDNNDGLFNIEIYFNSLWYPESTYLNRRYAKIQIKTAYLDEDDAEVGEAVDFEGLIDSVVLSESGQATLTILSYQSIFTKYPISDLSLTGSIDADDLAQDICEQTKITKFMPDQSPYTLGQNYVVTDTADLDGTYWDVLQAIAYKSDSTIVLENDTFDIKARSAGSVVWNFKGSGSDEPADIISIDEYDDEGIGKIRVYWKQKDGTKTAISADTTLLEKYLSEPEIVDLTGIDNATDQQNILDALLARWQQNRPFISFSCKYLINQVSLLDKITLEIRGRITPGDGTACIFGVNSFDDGSVFGGEVGGIIISSATEWMVTGISKDIQNWRMSISAEKVV